MLRNIILAALGLLVLPVAATQAEVIVGVGVPVYRPYHHVHYRPAVGVYVAPAPVVVVPPPLVVRPALVVVTPAPVIVTPAPVVVTPAPVYVSPAPVQVVVPR